jgi:Fic family protein
MRAVNDITYLYELPDWRSFRSDGAKLAGLLAAVRHRQGRLVGYMEAVRLDLRQEAILNTLTEDVLELKKLDVEEVRATIARGHSGVNLGMKGNAEGVVGIELDATRGYREPLTRGRLFSWHEALFPTGRSGTARIMVGDWRRDATGRMQVLSGERICFEAPPAEKVQEEVTAFLEWFNDFHQMDQVLKAALAHLWFVTIHPFDAGNGRIARVISDMTLARSEESSQRFYSMAAQIAKERERYYEILEQTQQGTMDITAWAQWFVACLGRAIDGAQKGVLGKARFWASVERITFNDRQRGVLNQMLEGIAGAMTNAKWAELAECSADTALRDLRYLVDEKVLVRGQAGGRSTFYSIRQS